MSKIFTVGNAIIDPDKFAAYSGQAMEQLGAIEKHKDDIKELGTLFKEGIESLSLTTKLPKAELTKYFKARFEETRPKEDEDKVVGTTAVIERGQLYTILNETLDN